MKWLQHYRKPKGDLSDYTFDIETGEFRIIRNCIYLPKINSFKEYGTDELFLRDEIVTYRRNYR